MRIAFVSLMTASAWGASEALWAETAQRALESGHQVFISTSAWPQLAKELHGLKENSGHIHLRTRNRWVRRSAWLARAVGMFAKLKHFRPDVICINQGGTYDLARSGSTAELRRVLRSTAIPIVLLCHCEQALPRRRTALVRRIFERMTIVGFTAASAQAVTENHLGFSLTNARVFQNPVNVERAERLPWPNDDDLRFAYVGRLEPVKNLHTLIESLAQRAWADRSWKLTLFGEGSLRESLERIVDRSGLARHVRFAGHVADVPSIWTDHHVLLLPSHREGVPSAMIEAMLCGRPVVATNTGGIGEWIQDGATGFLIAEATRMAVSNTLERVWSQRHQLQRMGEHAYTSVCSKRDPDPPRTLLEWLQEAAFNRGQNRQLYMPRD